MRGTDQQKGENTSACQIKGNTHRHDKGGNVVVLICKELKYLIQTVHTHIRHKADQKFHNDIHRQIRKAKQHRNQQQTGS